MGCTLKERAGQTRLKSDVGKGGRRGPTRVGYVSSRLADALYGCCSQDSEAALPE